MKKIENKEQLNSFLDENKGKVIVVKFGADWCTPCRMEESIISDLKNENYSDAVFAEVNVDEVDESFIEEFNIKSIPVLLFYKDGLLADRTVGLLTKDNLINKITEVKNK